jgi:hypothetical protein
MSAEHETRSHGLRWAILVLSVPVLYVLTFPPIVNATQKYFSHSERAMKFMVAYTAPYNLLLEQKPLHNPLVAYWDFWGEWLSHPPPSP